MGFKNAPSGDLVFWTGNPNCQAGHDFLRGWLRKNIKPYPVTWTKGDTRTQGNLGEAIAYCIGALTPWSAYHCFAQNVFNPFSNIARNSIDLVWVSFGATPADDFAIIQEVKTTFGVKLTYANTLIGDYDKAFGLDPRLTLVARFNEIKLKLEKEHQRPDLAARMNGLMVTKPSETKNIHCVPTLVHDLAGLDATGTLTVLQTTLKARGWIKVSPCSIALSDLEDRFPRLVEDKP